MISQEEAIRRIADMTASLIERAGMRRKVEAAQRAGIITEKIHFPENNHYKGITLPESGLECYEWGGTRAPRRWGFTKPTGTGGGIHYEQIGDALGVSIRSGGENTQSDYSLLLENLLRHLLLGFYGELHEIWRLTCGITEVKDFRASSYLRLGSAGTLPVVPEGEEVPLAPVEDAAKATVSAQEHAARLRVSRQALVADDLNGIRNTAERGARMFSLSIEKAFFSLLNANGGLGPTQADSLPFWDPSRGNVGTGSALSVAGLDADRAQLAAITDATGETLDTRADTLLVHSVLGGAARQYATMRFEDGSNGEFNTPTFSGGMFRQVADSARLGSTTRRYLFANPATSPAFMVAFLRKEDGSRPDVPSIEYKDTDLLIDGVEWKIRGDFGIQALEPKFAVTNSGT